MKQGLKIHKEPKLIQVTWHDACSTSEWQDIDNVKEWIENDKVFLCNNVGWLIAENKDFIVLSARFSSDDSQFGLCEKLPRKMIISMKNL